MRSNCKAFISLWSSHPGCLAISRDHMRDLSALVLVNVTTVTGQMEDVYNFGDSASCFQDASNAFQMYPHSCFTTYAPFMIIFKVYYSQEIFLPLHNAWTCHFYIKCSFHIYFLKKAGVHILLWSWSNHEEKYLSTEYHKMLES